MMNQKPYLTHVRKFLMLIVTCGLLTMPAWSATGPLNDNFANAQQISGNQGSAQGNNVGATKEVGEPNHAGNPGGMSAWFRWTAPGSGVVTFTTEGSNFDTILGIYRGSSLSTLTEVAHGDDVSSTDKTSVASFNAVSGTTYSIAVDGFNHNGDVANGNITLNWTLPPANDNFANAQALNGTSGSVTGTNEGASSEASDPGYGNTVWYRFTAPSNGVLTLDTSKSAFSTSMGVYTGTTLAHLTYVGETQQDYPGGPDNPTYANKQTVGVRAGSTLDIEVFGSDSGLSGTITLTYKFLADAIVPTVTITRPAPGGFISTLNAVRGTATDNSGGSGIRRVDVYIQRRSDSKYWDGDYTWVTAATPLQATLSSTDNTWSIVDRNVDYNSPYYLFKYGALTPGKYIIQAVASDKANNRSTATSSVTVDNASPTVSITTPANKATVATLSAISGKAADNTGGSGISRVDLLLQRHSDNKYWTGTTWSATSTALKTTLSGTGSVTWTRNTGNPSGANLINGSYILIAIAYDQALNSTRAQSTVNVHKAASVAVSDASAVRLSAVTAYAATASVQLRFTGALDADAASDASHYIVEVNGHAVTGQSAGYDANSKLVTLDLGAGNLHSGDAVVVTLAGVEDAHGATVEAQSGILTAQ